MDFKNQSIQQFTAATASGDPVPGGGSISALCGAFSSALTCMVAGLTIGKKKYVAVQDEMMELKDKVEPATNLLLKAVDMDSEAYDMVFQAYKLPKETDDEKAIRSATIQEALKHAANVPFSVAKIVYTFLGDIVTVAQKGNTNAITDAYVAALCARTAILGACANARINLASITDGDFAEEMKADMATIEAKAAETEETVRKALSAALE